MNLYEMTETAKQLMQLFEDGDIPKMLSMTLSKVSECRTSSKITVR